MNHPEEIPDFVIAAVTDGLNGYRNHTYTSFRAGNGNDRVRIGENGNYYFNSSSEVLIRQFKKALPWKCFNLAFLHKILKYLIFSF